MFPSEMWGVIGLLLSLLMGRALSLPMVDPGLFVISGVSTCGNGKGYCLLGLDCTLDTDFIADKQGGHCNGLRSAFTPSASFVCCSDLNSTQTHSKFTLPPVNMKENEIIEDEKPIEMGSSINPSTTEAAAEVTMLTTSYKLTTESTSTPGDDIVWSTLTGSPEETTEGRYETTAATTVGDIEEDSSMSLPASLSSVRDCCGTSRFMFNGTQICLGALINPYTVLTSASCSLKVFRLGMVNVFLESFATPNTRYDIRTIVVHEDYRPMADNILMPENNNLGLIILKGSVVDVEQCLPILPMTNRSQAGRTCRSIENITSFEAAISEGRPGDNALCIGELELMQGENNEDYYTLACDSAWDDRYSNAEKGLGKPLICDEQLTGIETSSGVGMSVFTPLAKYLPWIKKNARREPQQIFRNSRY